MEDDNPWVSDRCMSHMKQAVNLAKQTGFVLRHHRSSGKKEPLPAEMPSVQLMELQKKISHVRRKLHKTNLEIQRKMQHHEVKDIVQEDVLEKRVQALKVLTDHFQTLSHNKDALIDRLQQPFIADHIKMDVAYHKETCDVFHRLAPMLSGLSANLELISWMNREKFPEGELFQDQLIQEISGTLASLQSTYQAVMTLKRDVVILQTGEDDYSSQSFTDFA